MHSLMHALLQARDANVATSALHTGKAFFVTKPFAWIVAFGYRRAPVCCGPPDARSVLLHMSACHQASLPPVIVPTHASLLQNGIKVSKTCVAATTNARSYLKTSVQDAKDSVKSEINGVKLSVLRGPLRTGVITPVRSGALT